MKLDRQKIQLIVGGMIIFAVIFGVILAIKPRTFFKEARNATRRNHLQILMTAIYTFSMENQGNFPECLPEPGQPAVKIDECLDELRPYLMHLVFADPDPNYNYMIESFLENGEKKIKVFSNAPEAKNLTIIR